MKKIGNTNFNPESFEDLKGFEEYVKARDFIHLQGMTTKQAFEELKGEKSDRVRKTNRPSKKSKVASNDSSTNGSTTESGSNYADS